MLAAIATACLTVRPGARHLPAQHECILQARLRAAETEWHAATVELADANAGLPHWMLASTNGRGADLHREGLITLFTAAERLDPDQGYRFGIYAVHWIREALQRAVCDDRAVIRLSSRAIEYRSRLQRAARRYYAATSEIPDVPALAAATGIGPVRAA